MLEIGVFKSNGVVLNILNLFQSWGTLFDFSRIFIGLNFTFK